MPESNEQSPSTIASITKLAENFREQHAKLKASIGTLTDAMAALRILVKYQKFDLEATRRERDYYKGLYEEVNGSQDGGS